VKKEKKKGKKMKRKKKRMKYHVFLAGTSNKKMIKIVLMNLEPQNTKFITFDDILKLRIFLERDIFVHRVRGHTRTGGFCLQIFVVELFLTSITDDFKIKLVNFIHEWLMDLKK
jgi:hypothetical protein